MHKILTKMVAVVFLLAVALIFLSGQRTLADAPQLKQAEDTVSAQNCQDSSQNGIQTCLKGNPIVKDLNVIVNFLSAGVGIVVVGSLILGGIQYAMAGDSSDAVGKAKQRITNALFALVAFLLIFSFLQWIVPGGIFNS
jgi:FlaG/FlaF family flagellin (archaellin)